MRINSTVPITGKTARLLAVIAAVFWGAALHSQAQTQIPATFVLPSAAADTSQPGFVFRVHQVASGQPNENARTEKQLAGLLGENIADPAAQGAAIEPASPASPSTAPIRFDLPAVINMSLNGNEYAGTFSPDDPIPGLPGTTGSYDNAAAEILTWLDLPAGTITMGVNSDDGFRMTIGGATPIDKFAPVVGEFNGGRGATDTLFTFTVAKAGLHAVRCIWEQGGGGANIEMFTVKPDGIRLLVNDAANGGIRAYRAVTSTARAYARKVSPAPNSTSASARAPVVVELVDGASPINATTTALALDGANVPVMRSKAGAVTTVTYTPASHYATGSQHSVIFSYEENGALVQAPWTFTVVYDVGPNGHVYEVVLVENGITWPDAKVAAESKGMGGAVSHLATITSDKEDLFLERLRQSSKPDREDGQLWVGGYQQKGSADYWEAAGGWVWLNNEGPISGFNGGYTYASWHVNEPNNARADQGSSEDYLAIGLYDSFGWNDEGFYAGGRLDGTLGGYIVEYEPITLLLDIKPGDSTNAVNLVSNGKLPVAILSTAVFNATQIDVASIRFGRTGTETAPVSSSVPDVNGDGKKDLLLHFNVQDTELIGDDTEAILTALTTSRRPAQGRDRIQVIDCPHYTLTATAMQDVNKLTDLELVVQPLTNGADTPAAASQVQLKSFDAVGNLRWTKNFQNVPLQQRAPNYSVGNVQPSDALPHQPVKVKMLVPYSAGNNTEVIYGQTVVLLRPDLAVERIDAPSSGYIHQLVNVPAYLRELNGDLGATGDIYLMKGDTVLDTALNVSVPAHASVAVVFSTIFTEPGTHALKVVIGNLNPGDYDPSNNERTATLDVTVPQFQIADYYLSYFRNDFDELSQPSNPYSIWSYGRRGKEESIYQSLYAPVGVGFPIGAVQFQARVDGMPTPQVDLETINISATYWFDYGCARYEYASQDMGNGFYLDISSYSDPCAGSGYTNASISHYAADYVVFSSYHDLISGTGYDEMFENKSGTFINATSQIDTRFTISGAVEAIGGNASIGLFTYPYDDSWDNYYDYGDGYFERYQGHNRGTQVYGYSYGQTTP